MRKFVESELGITLQEGFLITEIMSQVINARNIE